MTQFRRLSVLILILCLILPLGGCGSVSSFLASRRASDENTDNTRQGYSVYYINEQETRLTPVSYRLESTSEEGIIEEMLKLLAQTPKQDGLKPVLAGAVSLSSYDYNRENKTITLHLDERFNSLSRTTQILITAALVKSLSQFSGILDYVSLYIGNRCLCDADGNPLLMKNEDFVVSLSGSNEMLQEASVNLYFASLSGSGLKCLSQTLRYEAGSSTAAAVLDALIRGPVDGDLLPVLSSNTHVNSVYVKDGLCQVDFNRGFLEKIENQNFSLNVYSVVNSLCDLKEIDRVSITVDGAAVSEAPDGMNLDTVLEADPSLVEETSETEQVQEPAQTEAPAQTDEKAVQNDEALQTDEKAVQTDEPAQADDKAAQKSDSAQADDKAEQAQDDSAQTQDEQVKVQETSGTKKR